MPALIAFKSPDSGNWTGRYNRQPDRPGGDAQMFNRIQKAWEQAQEELG